MVSREHLEGDRKERGAAAPVQLIIEHYIRTVLYCSRSLLYPSRLLQCLFLYTIVSPMPILLP